MAEQPSTFVLSWLPRLLDNLGNQPAALDLAMGTGRHSLALAATGFKTFGVDRDWKCARFTARQAAQRGLSLAVWVTDLEYRLLPIKRFELVICTNYLQRNLWGPLQNTVKSGGFIVYETYTVAQLRHRAGPRSPQHLLQQGELKDAFRNWQQWTYEELDDVVGIARLVARKPLQAGKSE